MSTTPREPLLSDDAISEAFTFGPSIKDAMHGYLSGANMVRDIYEAARAKDAELIQRLVDALNDSCEDLRGLLNVISPMDGHMINMCVDVYQEAIDIAVKRGFKPSEE